VAKSKLIAAALLKDDLADDEKINTALFSAAFEELDDLRKALAKIPVDVDASALRFQKITTQSVDDFVSVANEALSKFMQRTNEMKATLDAIEKGGRVVAPSPAPAQPVAPATAPIQPEKHHRWVVIPCSVFGGIIIGVVMSFFILKW